VFSSKNLILVINFIHGNGQVSLQE